MGKEKVSEVEKADGEICIGNFLITVTHKDKFQFKVEFIKQVSQ